MAEKLFDTSKAKEFLDSRDGDWYIWYLIKSGRANEIWVDNASNVNSLMVVEKADRRPYGDTDADICIETDSNESLLNLLSVLEPSKSYLAMFRHEWMCQVFRNEFNIDLESIHRQYHYNLIRDNFSPCKLYTVVDLSVNDSALVDTIPEEDWRDRIQRHLGFNTKAYGIVEDNYLVSCAFSWDKGEEREIDFIYTRPDKRNQGYGSSVASTMAEYIFQTGGKIVSATVDQGNMGSLRIWERLGFKKFKTTYFCSFRKS